MSESDIERAAEAHFNHLFDIYYGTGPEPCCKNCRYHAGRECCLCEWDDDVPDYRLVDADDWCEHYRKEEDG